MNSNNVYTIQEIPGKGLGLVATVKIAKGTRIFSEEPLVLVPGYTSAPKRLHRFICEELADLSDERRQAFFSLHNAFEGETTREIGLFCTNALPLWSGAFPSIGVFPDASRINHDCAPNARTEWDKSLFLFTVRAIRAIDAGEEITIMYLGDCMSRAARQKTLQLYFRFTCSCKRCDAGLDETRSIDEGMQELQQYADLRDDETFPPFRALPYEHGIDLNYVESHDGYMFRRSRYWCFLAEIVDTAALFRLVLIVEDKAGHKVPIWFYTDHRGRELDYSLVQKGFTVAVLYPEQHGFLDMSVGVRHEHPQSLKIFPVALKDLLNLSDKVQQYATETKGKRTCHGCSLKTTTLKKCARCGLFWYCGKTCQTLAWNEKGHKADCKLVRDPDFQVLIKLEQEDMRHQREFSVGL